MSAVCIFTISTNESLAIHLKKHIWQYWVAVFGLPLETFGWK